jgi:hypothetical protein
MGAKAQPKAGGRKAGTPNKIQSALSIIRAEVFAEARCAPAALLYGIPQFRRRLSFHTAKAVISGAENLIEAHVQ